MQLTTKETIKFILRSLQDSKTLFFIFVSLVLIFSLYESTLAYGIKILIDNFDNVTDEQFMNNLYKSGIKITIIVIIFEIIQKTFSFIWNVKLSSILYKNIVTRCFTEILKKQYIFFNKTLSGNITSKIDDLGNSTVKIILLVIDSIIYNIFLISSCAIAIFISNKECGIFTISSIIIFGIISIFLIKRSIKLSKYAAESHANYIGKTLNSFTNIQSIKLFFASRLESIFNQKYINRYYIDNVRLQKNNMYIFISGGALLISLFSINIYILINQKIQNIITTGEAVMIITLVTTITVQCWNTAFYFTNLADYYGKISQAIQILQLNNIAKDNNNTKKLEITNGKIIFKNVSFNYNDTKSSQEIFDNLSITIESNQVVALIGKSGSGKSTFVNLLLKLYEIDKGQILIDDQDIYKCSDESFYENITLVPQNTILFNRTIRKNILYAKKDADMEDVIRVSKMAEIHEFIMSLPDGYETIIDEGNTNISGGQRQRIAIARAFLKNSPIFIIDEGTSALDNTTEFNVYKSMENFMKNKTVLVITHDISILNKVDRVLFFSEGKIVADGQYNELINSNLEFRDFVNNKFDTTH